MSRVVISLAALVGVAVVCASGCRAIAGVGDEPTFDAEVCGDLAFRSAGCADCMARSCCGEARACGAARGCRELQKCTSACAPTDAACASACRTASKSTYTGTEAEVLAGCSAARCDDACGGPTCGGWIFAETTCTECSRASCCADGTACATDPECARVVACERACAEGDADCLRACELAHPRGVDKSRAFSGCLSGACPTACGTPKWECLRHPSAAVPPATAPVVQITYRFTDYQTSRPAPGLSVRPCIAQDLDCNGPLGPSVTTNSDGEAIVGFGGNLFSGYAEISGPGYPTTLLFFPTIGRDFVTRPIAIATRAALSALAEPLAHIEPTAGQMVVAALDCTGLPAVGVQLALDPADGSTPFYFARGIPSKTATATDEFGAAGGFVNVKATTALTIRAKSVATGLDYLPVTVHARPGALTYVQLYPKPL